MEKEWETNALLEYNSEIGAILKIFSVFEKI